MYIVKGNTQHYNGYAAYLLAQPKNTENTEEWQEGWERARREVEIGRYDKGRLFFEGIASGVIIVEEKEATKSESRWWAHKEE